MSWKYLEGRRFCKTSWRHLENYLKTSWRCFKNVLRTFEDVWLGRIYWSWRRRLENVFWTCMTNANMFALIKTSWGYLEEVFWRQRPKTFFKTSSRRFHQEEILVGLFSVLMTSSTPSDVVRTIKKYFSDFLLGFRSLGFFDDVDLVFQEVFSAWALELLKKSSYETFFMTSGSVAEVPWTESVGGWYDLVSCFEETISFIVLRVSLQ